MIITSLQRIFDAGSWVFDREEFRLLMKHEGKDFMTIDHTPLAYKTIVEVTTLEYALDCTVSSPEHERLWRGYALWCAQPVFSFIGNDHKLEALEVFSLYMNEKSSKDELEEIHSKVVSSNLRYEWTVDNQPQRAANQALASLVNPDFNSSITETWMARGLFEISLNSNTDEAERMMTIKFLELVS